LYNNSGVRVIYESVVYQPVIKVLTNMAIWSSEIKELEKLGLT